MQLLKAGFGKRQQQNGSGQAAAAAATATHTLGTHRLANRSGECLTGSARD